MAFRTCCKTCLCYIAVGQITIAKNHDDSAEKCYPGITEAAKNQKCRVVLTDNLGNKLDPPHLTSVINGDGGITFMISGDDLTKIKPKLLGALTWKIRIGFDMTSGKPASVILAGSAEKMEAEISFGCRRIGELAWNPSK